MLLLLPLVFQLQLSHTCTQHLRAIALSTSTSTIVTAITTISITTITSPVLSLAQTRTHTGHIGGNVVSDEIGAELVQQVRVEVDDFAQIGRGCGSKCAIMCDT